MYINSIVGPVGFRDGLNVFLDVVNFTHGGLFGFSLGLLENHFRNDSGNYW